VDASIVVKMVINHLTVPNRKKVDHHLAVVAVVVVAVEVVAMVLNVVLVVMKTAIVSVKQPARRSNSTTMTSDSTN
jgi:hypothetical protein